MSLKGSNSGCIQPILRDLMGFSMNVSNLQTLKNIDCLLKPVDVGWLNHMLFQRRAKGPLQPAKFHCRLQIRWHIPSHIRRSPWCVFRPEAKATLPTVKKCGQLRAKPQKRKAWEPNENPSFQGRSSLGRFRGWKCFPLRMKN